MGKFERIVLKSYKRIKASNWNEIIKPVWMWVHMDRGGQPSEPQYISTLTNAYSQFVANARGNQSSLTPEQKSKVLKVKRFVDEISKLAKSYAKEDRNVSRLDFENPYKKPLEATIAKLYYLIRPMDTV
jgi:hypothetical protein